MDFKQLVKKYFWQTAFFGWAVILLILSVIPYSGLIEQSHERSHFRWDYLEHFAVFAVFALLFGLWKRKIKVKKNEILWFLFSGSLYANVTELIQFFVEGRTVNPLDILFNLAGLYAGSLLIILFLFNHNFISSFFKNQK